MSLVVPHSGGAQSAPAKERSVATGAPAQQLSRGSGRSPD
jgi:hypothetical protein